MTAPCPAPAPGGPLVSGLIEFVDCQSQALGTLGYRALAAPSSSVSLATTGLLVIFVALFGYRMLLGEAPDLRAGVLAAVRAGVVLMLGTSFAAYSVLVYDVAVHVPVELAAELGRALDLPGTTGDMPAELQATADQLDLLRASGGIVARLMFLLGALWPLLALRIAAGLLLAIGPLAIAFLLFDATRGLVEGWVRALVATAFGMTGTLLLLGIQLAVLAPAAAELVAAQRRLAPPPHGPLYLPTLTMMFALTILAGLLATWWIAAGVRFPPAPQRIGIETRGKTGRTETDSRNFGAAVISSPAKPTTTSSRATVIANILRAADRKDAVPAASTTVADGKGFKQYRKTLPKANRS